MENTEMRITEQGFLDIRNALTTLAAYGFHTAIISKNSNKDLQERIEWGFGEKSDTLCNIKIVEL